MCGILGFSGSFDPVALARGNRCQAHRGPDDSGEFLAPADAIGLAHRRLSIQDLSPLGHQPMSTDDGRLVIVFNGEIYNFRELRAELVSRGCRFRGHSDTEVLLKLYETEGEAMLSRLNGIFAFAVWDASARSLFVARDAFGVKPLYFTETNRGFAFASELGGLLQLVPECRELDVEALHRYLTFLWNPGNATPLRDVRKLGPGEAVVVQAGRIARRWTWYELPVFRGVTAGLSSDEAVKGTADHLREAVKRQLVSDVPVGAFLSGGLDSSAVVAFAREITPDIRCFTIESVGGSEAGTTDDLPYARRVAKHLGVQLDVVSIDADRMAGDLPGMIAQLGEPLADPAPLNVLYISRLAREHGIKVLLSGAGGDDLFTGYRRHAAQHYERLWSGLPRSFRARLERATRRLDQRKPLWRRATKLFEGASLDGNERVASYFKWAREPELVSLYTPAFGAAVSGHPASGPMVDFLEPLPQSVAPLDRMLALEQRFFLADHNLAYTDRMSMAAGVEARVPFLDLDLVEFAARIPMALKQRGREGKWVLKKAMEPYLPPDVIYRPKTGFGAPLRRWMRGELHPLLNDVLSPDALARRGLFAPAAVTRLIEDNDAGRVDAAYTLFSILSIELWCRQFIDRAAP